jgi:dipeptidyl aminopeptidase/acylaminoacyl peptidase
MNLGHRTPALLLVAMLAACAGPEVQPSPGSAPAPGTAAAPETVTATPLIDREIFFEDPEITGGQLSPDGKFVLFRRPYQGVMNVWVKRREQPFDAARPITADRKRPVRMVRWTEDSKRVLFLQDEGGNENFHLFSVDPAAPAVAGTGVPPAKDLTPYPNVKAELVDLPENTPGTALVALNDRDPKFHDLYRVDLRTGKRQLVFKNDQNLAGYDTDLRGKLRLAIRQTPDGGTEILRIDGRKLTPVYACSQLETCYVQRFHKDGKRVYLVTNKGDADLVRLLLFDPATKAEEPVETDPENQVDLMNVVFSDTTEEMVGTVYMGDRLRVYPREETFRKDYELLKRVLPDGDLRNTSGTEDGNLQLVTLESDVDPGAAYLYDRRTGKVDLVYRPRPKLPVQHLAKMTPVRITARDGVRVPGYLTLPRGSSGRNLPTVMVPHGGPWGRDEWGFNGMAQFLANRGYAVLQPNFRGSAGFGKKFLNLGNGQWGTGTMQHDLTDAARWLVSQGISDPRRIGILGGSYGGFATLAGVTFTPDVYAAGVDIVGPSSIPTLLAAIPPYWAPLKKLFAVRVGDIDNPTDLARLKAQSPLYSAHQIRAPLLVIQGANDPRVKQVESDQIVAALRDAGRPVEYLVAPDEGHGFAGQENRLAMYAAIERFLSQHLGGRHQNTMGPAVATRLAAMTVDIRKVAKTPPEKIPAGPVKAGQQTK